MSEIIITMSYSTVNLSEFASNFTYGISTLLFSGILLLSPFSTLKAQNSFMQGKEFYRKRAAHADTFKADPTNINKAIKAFNKSLNEHKHPEESAIYLLRSYYFKGMYVNMPEERQKEIYDKGADLGEKWLRKYPQSVGIKFWYAALLGRWAKIHGFVASATHGISKKLRRISKDIIRLDSTYQGGGGYRILAQVHFYSPNIPFFMSWPSDDKALKLIKKAMKISPDNPTNRMLYAQVLIEFDQYKEAKKHLQFILNMHSRPTHKVEDRYLKYRSHQLLEKNF